VPMSGLPAAAPRVTNKGVPRVRWKDYSITARVQRVQVGQEPAPNACRECRQQPHILGLSTCNQEQFPCIRGRTVQAFSSSEVPFFELDAQHRPEQRQLLGCHTALWPVLRAADQIGTARTRPNRYRCRTCQYFPLVFRQKAIFACSCQIRATYQQHMGGKMDVSFSMPTKANATAPIPKIRKTMVMYTGPTSPDTLPVAIKGRTSLMSMQNGWPGLPEVRRSLVAAKQEERVNGQLARTRRWAPGSCYTSDHFSLSCSHSPSVCLLISLHQCATKACALTGK